jgi:hypothetical protein
LIQSAVLKLLCESEPNLNIFSGLVGRRHERPFANSLFRGVRENLASGDRLGISDFPRGVDNGLNDDRTFNLQMSGNVRVLGRHAVFDGAHAGGSRVHGDDSEKSKCGNPEDARCRAMGTAGGRTERSQEHLFFPWRKVRTPGSSAARDGFLREF